MSLRAHLFSWIIRRQVKGKLGSQIDVAKMRAMFEGAAFPLPRRVVAETSVVAGVSCERVRIPGGHGQPRLLYIHGGGFIACSARTHRAITGGFARRGFDVLAPDYRLAPEHPFPAGLDDLVAVWRSLSASGPAVLAGDSAGGNLALALMVRAKAEGLPMPQAAALFSPAVDLLGRSPSLTTNAMRDPALDADALRELVPLYIGTTDAGDPLVSPIEADFAGFPPMLVHVGEREILRDDSVRLVERARAAGVSATLAIYPVVPHVWQAAQVFLPEARHSLAAAAAFLANPPVTANPLSDVKPPVPV